MLITFEGIDGSGKSTQAQRLTERLDAEGYQTLLVREPGGTDLSEQVRGLLLDPSLHIEPFAEMLLFSAARAQLVAERIRPALEAGTLVVCDRFYDSTTVYQGAGRQLGDVDWLHGFNQRITRGLVPDRTYLIEMTPEAARARLPQRQTPHDRMEEAGDAFYQRVVAAYAQLAEVESDRFLRLDGRQSIEALEAEIWADVQQLLARHGGTLRSRGSSSE